MPPVVSILPPELASQAVTMPYGPAEASVEMIAALGEVPVEYAAIRSHAALMDRPDRGVLEVTGADRVGFLNRMLTQELKDISPGSVRRSFWLGRTGRIESDLRVIHLPDRTLLEMDLFSCPRTLSSLEKYVITEDVRLTDISAGCRRLSLHGPRALAALNQAGATPNDLLEPARAAQITLASSPVLVFRDDTAGEIGLELLLPAAAAGEIYRLLLPHATPCGWMAYNTARIEAGTPLYNIDFGENSLPAETGVLNDRVSFTKGCYLGQEIVARMHARGQSKQTLAAIRLTPEPGAAGHDQESGLPFLPLSGESVLADTPEATPVGVITSSTLSPMLGAAPVCFAQMKPAFAKPDAKVRVQAEGRVLPGTVQPRLRFWSR